MKKLTKPITTAILTAALLITSIGTGSFATIPVTANAATTTGTFIDGSTVTMKIGDVKKLLVTNEDGKDYTDKYKWSSSDTNIVKIEKDFVDETTYDLCLILAANDIGTVTITGKFIYSDGAYKHTDLYENRPDVSITVNVEKPKVKMTPKQKKCKHKYKVTKKATCERTGIKTCKKCKWQKILKTTDHKWVDTEVLHFDYAKEYLMLVCIGCCCDTKCEFDNACPNPCTKVFKEEDYGSPDAMMEAYYEHLEDPVCKSYTHSWGTYNAEPYEYTSHELKCEYCGIDKKD